MAAAPLPGSQLGKYRLVKRLAAGGMAEVYLARTQGPAGFSKLVVVKRILPHLAEHDEFVQMFLNEARLAAQLNHPNVIQIFELGQEQGAYFLAMELVDGPNLRALAKAAHARGERLPVPVVLKVISLACEGLAYAHEFADESGRELQLVHRDISPDNLLLSRQGSVKVADFGIAKAANLPNLTKTGTLKGKLNYMPPEQLLGQPLDRRGDVFALGVVLHEVLAGKKPFNAESEVSAMRSILQDAPQRIAELRPEVPPQVQAIVDKALAKDRDQRYLDCRAFQADLEQFLISQGAPVRAIDVSNLVERYFPKEPVPQTQTEPVTLEESLIVSMSQVIEDPGTGPLPPPDSVPEQPLALVAKKRAAPAEPPTALLQTKAPLAAPIADRPPPSALAQRSSPWPWIAGAVVVVGLGGALILRPTLAAAPTPVAQVPKVAPAPVEPPKPVEAPSPEVAKVEAPKPEAAKPVEAPKPQPVKVEAPKPEVAKVEPPRREREHSRAHRAVHEEPALSNAVAPAPQPAKTVVVIQQPVSAPAPSPAPAPVHVAPVAAGPGKLRVQIQPWAEVEVDGQSYGLTPIAPISLLAGEHKVRLKNGDLHVDRTLTVTVESGKQQVIKLNLAE